MSGDVQVAEGSIRERILKLETSCWRVKLANSCRGLDPREDTETA